MVRKQKRLGELLIEAGLITQKQLDGALSRQRQWGDRLGANLIATGAISDVKLQLFLARNTGIKELDLENAEISREIANLIPHKVAEQFNLIPVRKEGKNAIVVACADPTDLNALDQVAFVTGCKVIPVISSYSSIVNAINHYMLGIVTRSDEASVFVRSSETKVVDVDVSDTYSEDPDLIIFGGNESPPAPKEPIPALLAPDPVPEPEPLVQEPGPSLDEELGFDFGRPLLKYASEPVAEAAATPGLDSSQFTFEQKMNALFQVLIRKGLISEQEINSELMRLWSLGELK